MVRPIFYVAGASSNGLNQLGENRTWVFALFTKPLVSKRVLVALIESRIHTTPFERRHTYVQYHMHLRFGGLERVFESSSESSCLFDDISQHMNFPQGERIFFLLPECSCLDSFHREKESSFSYYLIISRKEEGGDAARARSLVPAGPTHKNSIFVLPVECVTMTNHIPSAPGTNAPLAHKLFRHINLQKPTKRRRT